MWPCTRSPAEPAIFRTGGFPVLPWVLMSVLATGCATVEPDPSQAWRNWFRPVDAATSPRFDARRLDDDRRYLEHLIAEADDLALDVLQVRRTIRFREPDYISEAESHDLALLLRRILNLRASLREMAEFYQAAIGTDERVQARGMVLALNADANTLALGSHLAATFLDERVLREAANAAYRRYEIPARTHDLIVSEVTHPDLEERGRIAYLVYSHALADPDSTLSVVVRQDRAYDHLIRQGERAFVDSCMRIHYIKSTLGIFHPEFDNQLRHSSLVRLGDSAWHAVQDDGYRLRGLLYKNVGRVKQPVASLTVFSKSQRELLFDRLEPGDILLTYTAGYMSNIFLPGFFKHGIIYCGDPAARAAAGLTEAYLDGFAVSEEQRERLVAAAAEPRTRAGRPSDVIEAVAEGVKYSSLPHLLDTHISRLLVLRPRLDPEGRQHQLATALAVLGVPYDFKFDFSDASYLCCTELVYRALEGMGPFSLPLTRSRGRWVLNADDLVVSALTHPAGSFEVVLYAEPDPGRLDGRARFYADDEAEQRLHELFALEDVSPVK